MMQKLDNRDFDAIMLGWSAVIEDDLYQTYHSSQIAGDGDDFVSYSNPEVDAAIVAARTELDAKARMPLWQKCERMIVDDEPYTFLYVRKELMFADKRIKNIEPSKLGLNYVELFVQPIPWYIPANQRKWTK
jgi:peptide/nickel transport system substrate-binding protein